MVRLQTMEFYHQNYTTMMQNVSHFSEGTRGPQCRWFRSLIAYLSLDMSGIVIGGQYNVYDWRLIIACIDYKGDQT